MSSWTQAGITVLGEKVLWTDLAGNILSLGTVWLAMRRTIWTWPVQLAGAVLLLVASISAHAPGNALKQVLFIVLVSYGWARWLRGLRESRELPVRPATGRERLALVATLAVGTAAVALLFANIPWLQISWSPLANAYIFVGSAVATFAQSRALVDFWVIWVLVDLVGVPLAVKSGLYVSGAAYGIFFVLVMAGLRDWLKQYRRQRRNTEPEVVAA
ncbi:nicotinamide mononucleotide transporter family protein [Actinoallomurus spadix]|uniref:Nicotinamide mononucleotide transporter family protein n=1 Tax=Actinoallomurus spadix TaxID=79912 RepID=A0ABP3FS75_9ACTN|nr:nicotinamide mononucleotide transporter family protein [Actinoallomurus spadix]MCO5985597.1 nicotinamide mononucleotide transporter family protein [Actinoallomurus spadix]